MCNVNYQRAKNFRGLVVFGCCYVCRRVQPDPLVSTGDYSGGGVGLLVWMLLPLPLGFNWRFGVGSWVKNLVVECGSFCWRFIRTVVAVSVSLLIRVR